MAADTDAPMHLQADAVTIGQSMANANALLEARTRAEASAARKKEEHDFVRRTVMSLADNYEVVSCERHPLCRGDHGRNSYRIEPGDTDASVRCDGGFVQGPKMVFSQYLRECAGRVAAQRDYSKTRGPISLPHVLEILVDGHTLSDGVFIRPLPGHQFISDEMRRHLYQLSFPHIGDSWVCFANHEGAYCPRSR